MQVFFKKYSFYILLVALVIYFVGKYLYAQPKYINGEIAPNITSALLDNTSFQLSDLKGQYVLVDFWGSWCGPCVQEAPDLRALYDKFHGKDYTDAKGFEIVSVGIEEDKTRWLNAIQRLGLRWRYHVSDLQYFDSPFALSYGVRVIPTKFLLNTEGVIIGVNQPFDQLEKFLTGKLK